MRAMLVALLFSFSALALVACGEEDAAAQSEESPAASPTPRVVPTPTLRPKTQVSTLTNLFPRDVFIAEDFEEFSLGGRNWVTVSDGIVNGWRVEGTVDVTGTYWQAARGTQSLDLHGFKPGAISREFQTVPGQRYELCFAASGNPTGGEFLKVLAVWWDDARVAEVEIPTRLVDASRSDSNINMSWEYHKYSFIAREKISRVKLQGVAGGAKWGPVVDDIRISTGSTGCTGRVQEVVLPTPTPVPTATALPTVKPAVSPEPTKVVRVNPTPTKRPAVAPQRTTTPVPSVTPGILVMVIPLPTATPVPKQVQVAEPLSFVLGTLYDECDVSMLPGQRCAIRALQIFNAAAIDTELVVAVESPPELIVSVDGVDQKGKVVAESEGRTLLIFRLEVSPTARTGTYGPIEVIVSSSVGAKKRIRLFEQVEILPALELVELEQFECEKLRVGEECQIFQVILQNHARVARFGRLKVEMPSGVQVFWRREDEETGKRALSEILFESREKIRGKIFLVAERGPLEFGKLKLEFQER